MMVGLVLTACDDPVGSDNPDDGDQDDTAMSPRVVYSYYLRTDPYLASQFYDPSEYELEGITVYIWVNDYLSSELDTIIDEQTEFTLHPPDGLSVTHEDGGSFSANEPFSTHDSADSVGENTYDNYRVFLPDGGLHYRYREESETLRLDRFQIDLDGGTEDVAGTWIMQQDGEPVEEIVLRNAPQATEDGEVVVPNPKLTLNDDRHIIGIEVKFQSADSGRESIDPDDYTMFNNLDDFSVTLTQYSPERDETRVSAPLPVDGDLQFEIPADAGWSIDDEQDNGRVLQSLRMSARYSGYQYAFTIRP